ncbi:uncharacterized protein HD556DRAFT_1458469 [Suillus plorans]|uniref:Uncharacterized protein n=1 Tax=Suillus plorans TaxID=116603 RepID=A0A9P7AC67_9AGAM|nr:uncharacterized protein HD556DRAFT_1458469 [Suillus plorans]KAG1785450.1 hypothetical protein HD556DRAFT_1458469 [Suillus plorans]
MAFKSKSVKRFSIRNFLAAILHPFMSSPTDAPGVFTPAGKPSHIDVGLWHSLLFTSELSAQCKLKRMVYGKCTIEFEHEFLLLYFRHPTQHHAVAILTLERTCAENTTGSSRSAGQAVIVSPSVSPITAQDTITPTTSSSFTIDSYVTQEFGPHKYLFELDFPASARPSAMQVSILLCVLSKHSPMYELLQYQCYWYAYTVWEALKKLFPEHVERPLNEGRSRFKGQPIKKAESVNTVCEQYRAEWARFEEAAGERRRAKEEEERRRKADEERRQREEAEWRADEERRQREEAEWRADEERRQREGAAREHEAEMNRMRARMAELERRAAGY